ncbi:MAG: CopG family antitoxin [Burkholderiales bacterium]
MNATDKVSVSECEWESGKLGREEQYVRRASKDKEASLDEAMNLQMISIRLQHQLIEDLKFIAKANGVGYQPLIRDVLQRFVVGEVKEIVREVKARRAREEAGAKLAQEEAAREVAEVDTASQKKAA